jgi:hypothetical protein
MTTDDLAKVVEALRLRVQDLEGKLLEVQLQALAEHASREAADEACAERVGKLEGCVECVEGRPRSARADVQSLDERLSALGAFLRGVDSAHSTKLRDLESDLDALRRRCR